jgi:hypothetical protein
MMNGDIKAEWGHTSFAGISLKLRNVPDQGMTLIGMAD